MKNLLFKYGLIAGLIPLAMVIVMFTTNLTNMENGEIFGYASMLLGFSTIYIATKTYRDNQLGGSINFLKAFKLGLGITLIASLIYIIGWIILSNTIASDFMAEYTQKAIDKINTSDLTDLEKTTKINEMKDFQELYKNPLVKAGITFLEIFPVGFLVSIISAIILKRK